ncbi:AaceriABR205Cp [[Ashbya] aceris (nom. inval.)]|nr:AaceriABR205Cp [[Ashbya] aceris (nom. inval.)]
MSTRYMDLLTEQQGQLDDNYRNALGVLDALEALAAPEQHKEDQVAALRSLQTQSEPLLRSLVMLRVNNVNCVEAYATRAKIGPASDVAKSKLHATAGDDGPDNVRSLVTRVRELQMAWLQHLQLVNQLSVELAYPLGSRGGQHVTVDREGPPPELAAALAAYDAGPDAPAAAALRAELLRYLDNIKATRARYLLENKYLLSDSLRQLTRDVSAWSQKWESLEGTLFGDAPSSLRSLLRSVDTTKAAMIQSTAAHDLAAPDSSTNQST